MQPPFRNGFTLIEADVFHAVNHADVTVLNENNVIQYIFYIRNQMCGNKDSSIFVIIV